MLRGSHRARYTWFGFEGGWEARKGVDTKKAAAESVAEGKDLESGGTTTPQGELSMTEKTPVAIPVRKHKALTAGMEDDDETWFIARSVALEFRLYSIFLAK
ncbi:hypothetical protein DFH08DRAFT_948251 [Mycena albidolilacea]|uniref:Uncharacterized protein n=1 Tax=Mycena albidolilacea TaxID=1033008 RepID=A0AAD7AQR4_9AGAR|nr:hypothetical protein DFH08DRAFT_948251 [Mycena albidolilacea]